MVGNVVKGKKKIATRSRKPEALNPKFETISNV